MYVMLCPIMAPIMALGNIHNNYSALLLGVKANLFCVVGL